MKIELNYVKQKISYKASLVCLFLLGFSYFSNAQNTNVSGLVVDQNNFPIAGVNIIEKGTINGTSTNFDGKYSISVNENASLIFSYIGYVTQEIVVGTESVIKVTLKEDLNELDEIVVIGYGSQNREQVTSAISSVDLENVEDLPRANVDQLLQGQASGVTVGTDSGRPGSPLSVNIRGVSSLTGSNQPLYIIDGVPVSGDATNSSTSGEPASGEFAGQGDNNVSSPLSSLNPNDIESIDILKDASATAIYGNRAANGVVIVKTKSGKKGKGKLTYDHFVSLQNATNLMDVMKLPEYAVLQNDISELAGRDPRPEFANPQLLGPGTDWQDEIFRLARTDSHQLSFSGATDDINYYLSGGYLNQKGIVIGSGFQRYSFRSNITGKVKKWLNVGAYINAAHTDEDITLNSSPNGVINLSVLQPPDSPVYDTNGDFFVGTNDLGIVFNNPVATALSITNNLKKRTFSGNMFAEADIVKGLKYRMEVGTWYENSKNLYYKPGERYLGTTTASLVKRDQNFQNYTMKNLLTYNFSLDKHKFTLLGGHESIKNTWNGTTISGQDLINENYAYFDLVEDPDAITVSEYEGRSTLLSFFGRLIYNFDNRYSLTASYRADGSSKFAQDNRWGYFGGISGAWNLSNEPFMSNFEAIKGIKFRLGYGEVGNQEIPNGRYLALLSSYPINSDETGLGLGFSANNIANENITWETQNQINAGVDFKLINERLSVTVDWYKKRSTDFLISLPLPVYLTGNYSYTGGVEAPYTNFGEMENTGWDFAIKYNTQGNTGLQWNSTLVVSAFKNKLTKSLDNFNLSETIRVNTSLGTGVVTNTVLDESIGQFWGLKTDGIFRTQEDLDSFTGTIFGETPQLGDVRYANISGDEDGNINEDDYTFIGNPNPDFTFGFTNGFDYKNFSLSIFLQGSVGNDVLNLTRRLGASASQLYTNQLSEAFDYYTDSNTDASLPSAYVSLSQPNHAISDRYVEDGSYLRIKNVSFGYNFPADVISKIKLSKLRLYTSVQNLYTFTDYSGYDPDIGSFNQNVLLQGIDIGRYPLPRTFTLGINVEF